MHVPFGDLRAHYHAQKQPIDAAVARVLESGWFILGEEVKAFEREFGAFLGTSHCLTVANGTDAIEVALRALKIGSGDEVITVSHTASFTALGITGAGARPVFVDVDERTYTLNPDLLEAAITKKTRAIMPVHLYGYPAELDAILEVARKHSLPVIEDAAQAHGGLYRGKKLGTITQIGCFSFYPSKNLGAFGDGGAIVTADPELADRVAKLRNGGQADRYHHELLGVNSRLDELQAAILRVELTRLDQDNRRRLEIAEQYSAAFQGLPIVLPPANDDHHTGVSHLYVIRVKNRDQFRDQLTALGIGSQIHYPIPAHQQPSLKPFATSRLPVTERLAAEILSLPIYPELREEHVQAVISAVKQVAAATA